MRVKRFSPLQRIFHALLMTSFLVQAATGLARMYTETSWGRGVARVFGGYDAARTVHVYVGIFMVCAFLAHIVYLFKRIDYRCFRESVLGPETILPAKRDLRDFFSHLGWFVKACEAPEFERWTYWEKFDYWAVFWGMVILGSTGLLLAYPLTASSIVPGWGLNVAFWVHRIEAILAMAHVFLIHFFIAHLRPHAFPMDRGMFEGSVAYEKALEEKTAWIGRLEKAGVLDQYLVPEAPPARRAVYYAVGYAAVVIGLYLLIGGLMYSRMITW